MKRQLNNFYKNFNINKGEEFFDVLLQQKNVNIKIERIISSAHKTPEGKWYNQDDDEWVIVLKGEAKIEFFDGEIFIMKEGDYLSIPKNDKHRVIYTSENPECLWLAIHLKNNV